MSTKNVVPRTTHQGQLGRVDKVWSAIHVDDVYADSIEAEGEISSATISATGSASVGSLTSAGNVQATGSVKGASGSFTGSVSAGSISSSGSITGSTLTLTSNTADTLFWLTRKATTQYQVGDIAYSPNLPSWARLECVQAGTTSVEEPTYSSVQQGSLVTDGTVRWIVDDVRDMTRVGAVTASLYLPPGYVLADGSTKNRADYPRLVNLIEKYNLWTDNTTNDLGKYGKGDNSTTFVLPNLIDRHIKYASSAGEKLEAGLPNIEGLIACSLPGGLNPFINKGTNALYNNYSDKTYSPYQESSSGSVTRSADTNLRFSASKANPIYGSSLTVRPPSVQYLPIIRY